MTSTKQQPTTKLSGDLTNSDITAELERILGSDEFHGTPRTRDFLQYIVEEAVAGRGERIKGYSVAVSVFGRGEDFDPSVDPIVRIEAGRMRRALERYYLTAGAHDPVVIDVPKGSYVPQFCRGGAEDGSAAAENSSTLATGDPSVLIMPFDNLGADEDSLYFAAGMTEEVISALSQYPGYRIVPAQMLSERPSDDTGVCRYARERGVRFVLTGTVRKQPKKVRVSIRLVDANDGSQTWTGSYDRELTIENLLDVQDDIAHEVVVSIAEQYGGAIGTRLARQSRETTGREPDSVRSIAEAAPLQYVFAPACLLEYARGAGACRQTRARQRVLMGGTGGDHQ